MLKSKNGKQTTIFLNIISSPLTLCNPEERHTVKVCRSGGAPHGALPCLSAVYMEETSAATADPQEVALYFGVLCGALIPLSGAYVCVCVHICVCMCACVDTGMHFSEICSRVPNHSSVHIFVMNKTLLALKGSTTQQARDVNLGTRQGSAKCLIWTTLLCLRRVFITNQEGEEAKKVFIALIISLSDSDRTWGDGENRSRGVRGGAD